MLHIRTAQTFFIHSTNSFTESLGYGHWLGDNDINTQPGRKTRYSIAAWCATTEKENEFDFFLDYRVHELTPDLSALRIYERRRFSVPPGVTNLNIGQAGTMNANLDVTISGKHHEWSNISGAPGLAGSYLTKVWRRLDGPGDDVKNRNMGIMAHVVIPIEYDVPAYRIPESRMILDGVPHRFSDSLNRMRWTGSEFEEVPEEPVPAELARMAGIASDDAPAATAA
jgi:hypothetical protein